MGKGKLHYWEWTSCEGWMNLAVNFQTFFPLPFEAFIVMHFLDH